MDAPHLTDPESGSSSPIRILNSIVTASSFFPIIAILSSFPTIKLMWSSSFVPSTVLETSVTNSLSFPGSRSALNPTQGYRLLEAGSSSTVILSSSFLLDVACLDLERFAENRAINVCNSAIFCSAFLFWSFTSFWISWLDSYQKS